jgi:hypothetical protein
MRFTCQRNSHHDPHPTIMSTERNPSTIDTNALETTLDIQVFNSDGGMVQFGDIFADQKAIVVFIRAHPVCPICLPLTILFF